MQSWVWCCPPEIPAPGRLKQNNLRKSEANLDYTVSLKPAWTIQTLSHKTNKEQKKREEEKKRDQD